MASDTRPTLIQAAARLLAERGSNGLTVRGVANAAGVSTMGVYTHFGSLEDLRHAVRDQGFRDLQAAWAAVETTHDPVADLTVSGATYTRFAVTNPHLYRAMFYEPPTDSPAPPLDATAVAAAMTERCIASGRFAAADPERITLQLWAATHGSTSGVLAGVIPLDHAPEHFAALGLTLYVGFGDDPEQARQSIETAIRRLEVHR